MSEKVAFAAAVTPLRDNGESLDEEAVPGMLEFLAAGGLHGAMALGTTGEGMLFSVAERRRVAEAFAEAAPGDFTIFVHAGAQTTAQTVELAAHAAELGVDGVAVIGPPYFALDEQALLRHFAEAARACAPTPFYAYELERASGYAIPVPVLLELREQAPNFAGVKISDTPWERFAPYVIDGLDVYVGPESLIHRGLAAGAVGALSGLAAAFPEAVAAAVRDDGAAATEHVAALRAVVERFPTHAALKHLLARRGVAVGEDVRAPLRPLTLSERSALDGSLGAWRVPEK